MKVTTARIKGFERQALVDAIEAELGSQYCDQYDDTYVFAFEKFYFRTNSNLLNVAILQMLGVDECKVDVISGGGGQGLLGFDWGAESSSNDRIYGILEDICKSNNWKLSVDNYQGH